MAEFDIDKFIASQKALQKAADEKQAAAEAAAKLKGADEEAARNVTRAARNKFEYADNLNKSLVDIEGQLRIFGSKIARGDKLDPIEQREFDRIVAQYKSVSTNYTKYINEGNKILAKMPKTFATEAAKIQKEAGAAPEVPVAPEDISITDFKDLLSDPKNSSMVRGYQESLKKLGWRGAVDGKYSLSFQAAVEDLYQKRAQLPEGLRAGTFQEFIGVAADNPGLIISATGGTGGTDGKPYATISPATQAAAYINNSFLNTLGRPATPAEIKTLTIELNNAERKSPSKTVKGITTGGINREQFLLDKVKALPEYKLRKTEALGLTGKDLVKTAALNGLDLTPDQIDFWSKEVDNGKNIDVVKNQIRTLAGLGMPDSVKKLLNEGSDLETIYSPYRTAMATGLEIPLSSIKLNDPMLRSAIGPDKEMSVYDFKRKLREDSRWQYTDQARQDVSSTAMRVLRDFGFEA